MVQRHRLSLIALLGLAASAVLVGQQSAPERAPDPFRFRTDVEFVNVTATVTDASGRFVPNLQRDDFIVYDNGRRQTVSHFSAERVPVSLGVVLDASGSMAGSKMDAARAALNRFLYDLLDEEDEVFIYTFDDDPTLIEGWTTDRRRVSAALSRLGAVGGTAMYDAIAAALPLASTGHHAKKALVLISDGNDTSSQAPPRAVKQLIRESEILVYAVGIDSDGIQALRDVFPRRRPRRGTPGPPPGRWPIPGRPGRTPFMPSWQRSPTAPGTPDPAPKRSSGWVDERVNVDALRDLTDDSGGRTEIVRDPGDLNPATSSIADELSRQYFLGYPSTGEKDGWHEIRVELKNPSYRIRARRGYVAN